MVVHFVVLLHVDVVQLQNPSTRKCMDTMGGREGSEVGVYSCHGQAGNQVSLTR